MRAAVDPTIAYAVAQQDLFFAAVVAGECAYQQGNLPADFKGRPEFKDIALPCGILVASFLAIQTDNGVVTPGGLILGAAGCVLAGEDVPRSIRRDRGRRDGLAGAEGVPGDRDPLRALRPPRQRRGPA